MEFLIEDHERAAMDYAGVRVVGPHDYMVVRPMQDVEGPSTVHIDVRATSREQAVVEATRRYREMRAIAELAPDAGRVVSVGSVAGALPAADRYVVEADDMIEQRRFELAVVAAQVHCEMHIRQAVAVSSDRAGRLDAIAPELVRSWALMDSLGPQIFAALLGAAPSSAACWAEYKAHVARRNSVVHRGATVSEAEAHSSLDAVTQMVRFVEQLARSASSPRNE